MSLEIREKNVLHNKKDRNDFINILWDLYKDDPNWVPPLKMALNEMFDPKHPFYATGTLKCWMAYKDGKPVGRIAASINEQHNKFHEEKTGFFGFYECIEDQEVSDKLLNVAEDYLRTHGMKVVQGPFNPSTNYECGTLIEGFDDPPQLMMTYNPPYHQKLIEAHQFHKAKDLLAYKRDLRQALPEVIVKISDRMMERQKITFRPANLKKWDEEVDKMLEVYNQAWEKNWGFIPMTPEEFRHTAKDLKMVVDPNLVLFVEIDGENAGFAVALPDLNQVLKHIPSGKLLPFGVFKLLRPGKYINRMRVITLGLKEKYRKMGLETLLYRKLSENSQPKYQEAEMSWILEDNLMMNKPLIRLGEVYKKYRIFEKTL